MTEMTFCIKTAKTVSQVVDPVVFFVCLAAIMKLYVSITAVSVRAGLLCILAIKQLYRAHCLFFKTFI